jgi:hypothetical protein
MSHMLCRQPPGLLILSIPRPLAGVREGARGLTGQIRRRGWRGREASPSPCAPADGRDWVGVACSGGVTRAVRPAVEENGGGGAPMVVSDEEEVGEL